MCLEFSKVNISSLNVLYKFWSNNVIPFLGEKVSGNRKNYEYLIESIKRFPDQSQLSSVIRSAEFKLVKHRNLSGGIAAIHSGWKI
jgi:demethylmenaquinone methyltransferase/2-methoxy-6-polyprenyl-1,4-benzoquinol methylase